MPRRLIDSRIWSNEKFGELPLGARVLLTSIVNHADDDGRLKAGAKYLRSIAFPYDDDITSSQADEWLKCVALAGFVRVYSVNGDRFLDVPGWTDVQSEFHQILRKDRYTASLLPPYVVGDRRENRAPATDGQPHGNQATTAGMLEGKVTKGKVITRIPNGILASSEPDSEIPQEAPPASSGVVEGKPGASPHETQPLLPGTKPPVGETADADDVGRDEAGTHLEPRLPTTEERRRVKQSNVDLVFQAVRDHFGFPDRTATDPIPNCGKEGKAISRLLTRGFKVPQILACWKRKTELRGAFVSFQYVNEDIAEFVGKDGDGRRETTRRTAGSQRASPRFGGYTESLERRGVVHGRGSGAAAVPLVPGSEIRASPP